LSACAATDGDGWSLGVDVGGTFTDAALAGVGRLFTAKLPTTPADQSEGVMAAIEMVLERAGIRAEQVVRFAHGMTVATNGLLEERGARTALVTTAGFTDVLEIGRQARPELYRLCAAGPEPLVPPELRLGVAERIAPDGVLEPLREEGVAAAVEQLAKAAAESVAVCLLHSYADPSHERRIAEAIATRLPDVHVSASHDVLGVFREYERTSTTVIDAYLSPLISRYLERLAAVASDAGLPEPEIMSSSGGLLSAAAAARHAAWTVLSGPAGGAVGAARMGELAGTDHVLSFDMGGTSSDVAVIDRGDVRQAVDQTIAGRALQLPMVDIHTVGAGGGSIGWADPGGALRAGPHSAGADPGPACYGRGGREPTVTDANLILGYLGAGSALAGGVLLDRELAEHAVGALARDLGLSTDEAAWGIVRVADQEMARALRVVTVERGVDPRRYALMAFGGAGPMHAARLAEELEIERVLCPHAAGVLSAVGLIAAEQRRDLARSVLLGEDEIGAGRAEEVVAELAAQARKELPGARIEVSYDLRYRGQAFELTVEGPEQAEAAHLRDRFERVHADRYGYADPEGELELVNVRLAAVADGRDLPLAGCPPPGQSAPGGDEDLERTSREAWFSGEHVETDVLRGALRSGEPVEGPAICELPEATVVVPPGWRGEVDSHGTLALEHIG
jgi:N-methylhydantoinase A